jgi:serine protease AprX
MKKIAFLLFYLITGSLIAQIAPDKYFIEFTDKTGTPYSIDHPEQFLSARSLERRARHEVPTTEQDLPVNPSYVTAVSGTGVTVLNRTKWFNGVVIYAPDTSALQTIRNFPFVNKVLKYHSGSTSSNPVGNDKFDLERKVTLPVVPQQDLKDGNPYGRAYNQIHMLKGDALHALGFRGEGMVIAVLDAGFYMADLLPVFDSLRVNHQILGTRDFVVPGHSVYSESSHGMSVLSTMAGNIPGVMVGTAPKAEYWLFRTEDVSGENYIEEYNWVSGAEVADSVGADVINSSLGYTTFDDSRWDHTWADLNGHTALATQGANLAASKGIAVVNSAGNEGAKPWRYISVPADGDNVLAVGAVDSLGVYAGFSSHGLPGGRIKPNVATQGQFALVAAVDSSIMYSSGTSFSSPIMAGLVACLWQAKPEISVSDLYWAIEMSGNQYLNPDTLTGYGIPDMTQALGHLGISKKGKRNTTIYPNPVKENLTVRYVGSTDEEIVIEIFSRVGQLLFQKEYSVKSDSSEIPILLNENYPSGFYILKIRSNSQNNSFGIIKL